MIGEYRWQGRRAMKDMIMGVRKEKMGGGGREGGKKIMVGMIKYGGESLRWGCT